MKSFDAAPLVPTTTPTLDVSREDAMRSTSRLEHSRSSVTPRIAAEDIASWTEASGGASGGWTTDAFAFIVYK